MTSVNLSMINLPILSATFCGKENSDEGIFVPENKICIISWNPDNRVQPISNPYLSTVLLSIHTGCIGF